MKRSDEEKVNMLHRTELNALNNCGDVGKRGADVNMLLL
jgi:hypothetical protein